jgi:hypothetical protein
MLTGHAVRLAGGALIITIEKDLSDDNADMIKATYVLVNLGIVPLLAAYDGFLGRMYVVSLDCAELRTNASLDQRKTSPTRTPCDSSTVSALSSSYSSRLCSSQPEP